jgi:ribosome-binding factor A
MSSQRVRRVNEALRAILAERLTELADPRLGMVTITEVRATPDLQRAEVFYTVLPDDEETRASTAEALDSAVGRLRWHVGAEMRLKRVPTLHFTEDPVPAQGRRIDDLIEETKAQRDDDA